MRWLITIGMLTYGTVAHADTKFVVYGAGARPCTEWTLDRTEKETWLTGFISGLNLIWFKDGKVTSDVLSGTNLKTVENDIELYCSDHPRVSIVSAADFVVGDVIHKATRSEIDALIKKATNAP